jgi:hypothetical protein
MDGHASELSVQLPDDLADSISRLKRATGRDNADIVTSALRTYLADQAQRDTIRSYFEVVPQGYPRAYVVTSTATLTEAVLLEHDRSGIERTFSQINRFAATELTWGPGPKDITVAVGVSGHSAALAADTAAKMVRNRLVDEHALRLDDSAVGVRIISVVELTI